MSKIIYEVIFIDTDRLSDRVLFETLHAAKDYLLRCWLEEHLDAPSVLTAEVTREANSCEMISGYGHIDERVLRCY
jgi:hypothetical protein